MISKAISTKAVSVFCCIGASVQPWLSSNIMKWNDRLSEHLWAREKRLTHSDESEMAASAGCGGKHGILKGPNVVSKSVRRKIHRRPLWQGRGDEAVHCYQACVCVTSTTCRWNQQAVGFTASGHAGDKQLSVRALLPVCRHLLWPGEIEWYSTVE